MLHPTQLVNSEGWCDLPVWNSRTYRRTGDISLVVSSLTPVIVEGAADCPS
ncbi:unnamed protein product [Staurois parvus]|uniref:Uncharacterized protein n=1 Tax=Staurois parvus TaxID=386267 RepID=A0ABN9BKU6_9NEOB|nr:unnamed protein product [Staurois parvus]